MANDAKIHDIAVRHIRKAIGDRATNSYESLGDLHPALVQRLSLSDGELVLISAYFSNDSWYVFTTRRIVSQFRGSLQFLEPSSSIRGDFPNFKGYDPKDESDERRAGVIPHDVATITAPESGGVIRFDYRTFQGSTLPMYAVLYWQTKHPFLDKLMTTTETDAYASQSS